MDEFVVSHACCLCASGQSEEDRVIALMHAGVYRLEPSALPKALLAETAGLSLAFNFSTTFGLSLTSPVVVSLALQLARGVATEDLHLQLEIGRGGGVREGKAVRAHIQAIAHGATGEQTLQLIAIMGFKTAAAKHGAQNGASRSGRLRGQIAGAEVIDGLAVHQRGQNLLHLVRDLSVAQRRTSLLTGDEDHCCTAIKE